MSEEVNNKELIYLCKPENLFCAFRYYDMKKIPECCFVVIQLVLIGYKKYF